MSSHTSRVRARRAGVDENAEPGGRGPIVYCCAAMSSRACQSSSRPAPCRRRCARPSSPRRSGAGWSGRACRRCPTCARSRRAAAARSRCSSRRSAARRATASRSSRTAGRRSSSTARRGEDTGLRVVAAVAAGAEVVVLCGDGAGARTVGRRGGRGSPRSPTRSRTAAGCAGRRSSCSARRAWPRRASWPSRCATAIAPRSCRGRPSCSSSSASTRACGPRERSSSARRAWTAATLAGRVAGEIAIRARQAGVPCHAVVGHRAISSFDVRILDLQAILEAASIAELESGRRAHCGGALTLAATLRRS